MEPKTKPAVPWWFYFDPYPLGKPEVEGEQLERSSYYSFSSPAPHSFPKPTAQETAQVLTRKAQRTEEYQWLAFGFYDLEWIFRGKRKGPKG